MNWQENFRNKLKENIGQLSAGNIDYYQPKLVIDASGLDFRVNAGETFTGFFSAASDLNVAVSGSVTASNPRLTFRENVFSAKEMKFEFDFDTSGLERGEVSEGEVYIISNAGEYILPFRAEVSYGFAGSEDGEIKSLFDFANLAQNDFEAATRVFASDSFDSFVGEQDRRLESLCRGYRDGKACEINTEHFLTDIRKKSPVQLKISSEEMQDGIVSFAVSEDVMVSLDIRKSGWGYAELNVHTEDSFIIPQRERVAFEDFTAGAFCLQVLISSEQLHDGKNFGRLSLTNGRDEYFVDFEIYREDKADIPGADDSSRIFRMLQARLMKLYLEFRINNIGKGEWISRSDSLIERMLDVEPDSIQARLYRVHSMIASGRRNDAREELKLLNSDIPADEPSIYSYYLYLSCLISNDRIKIKEAGKLVYEAYIANRNIDTLLWVLLYLDDSLIANPGQKFMMLRHQCAQKTMSPLLYLEAWNVLADNPSLLSELENFEIQLLNFAMKTGLMNPDIAKKTVFLAIRTKKYNRLLHKILCEIYREYRDEEILEAICHHLMNGERCDEEAFEWYARAVDRNLRISYLFDYYIYSLPADYAKAIPEIVRLYFRYTNELEDCYKASLFANVVNYCGEDDELLSDYYERIKQFAIECLSKGMIDENIKCLYDYLEDTGDRDFLEALEEYICSVAFVHRISTGDRDVKNIIVIEDELSDERLLPVSGEKVFIPIYSDNYELFAEYEGGIRSRIDFDRDTGWKDDCFMRPQEYLDYIVKNPDPADGICVFLAKLGHHAPGTDRDNVRYVNRLVKSGHVAVRVRNEFLHTLLEYYYFCGDGPAVVELLGSLDMSRLGSTPRGWILDAMVREDMWKEACGLLNKYGFEGVTAETLARLCAHILMDDRQADEGLLLNICYQAFRAGKYEENGLKYLIGNVQAPLRIMRSIYQAAAGFDIEMRVLCEKIIVQYLYTGSYMSGLEDIFKVYCRHVPLPAVEVAWYTSFAYDYFMRDSIVEEDFFLRLLGIKKDGRDLNEICALALILHYADRWEELYREETDDFLISTLKEYIRYFLQHRIVFKQFMCFRDIVPELSLYEGYSFIQYRADPKAKVEISYIIDGDDTRQEYTSLEMKSLKNGIFQQRFMLFYDERMSYYLSEKSGETEDIHESRQLDMENYEIRGVNSRYEMINNMLLQRERDDILELLKLVDVYRRRKYVTEHIFSAK